MTDQPARQQVLEPRKIGSFNTIGVITLFRKEVSRFTNVFTQTIAAPVVSVVLFYMIFALAFGGNARTVGDVRYLDFLLPGLVMMTIAQNAFANTSSSLLISKIQGNIVDLLMPPLSPFEILLAYVGAGIVRGLAVGVACLVVMVLVMPMDSINLLTMLLFAVLGSMMMATFGIIAGLFAEKFDGLAAITNFIVMPLTFLSGTFYSVSVLPSGWREVVESNPLFFMIDGFRYGMIGHAESTIFHGATMLICLNFGLLIYCYSLILTGYKVKS